MVSGDTLKVRMTEAVNEPPALVLLMGPAHIVGKQWPITQTEMYVGRVVESQIFVDDRSMSKRHGRVHLNEHNKIKS